MKYWSQVFRLPPRAAVFYVRAIRTARQSGDAWSLRSATPPHHLLLLLRLAKGRKHVVEIGTGSAWGTIVLALADHTRTVRSFDPYEFGHRSTYLALAGRSLSRITLHERPGQQPDGLPTDFLFIDASHSHDGTIAEFQAWLPYLEQDALVAFHDYYLPEVSSAISELGLDGKNVDGVYVWRHVTPGLSR